VSGPTCSSRTRRRSAAAPTRTSTLINIKVDNILHRLNRRMVLSGHCHWDIPLTCSISHPERSVDRPAHPLSSLLGAGTICVPGCCTTRAPPAPPSPRSPRSCRCDISHSSPIMLAVPCLPPNACLSCSVVLSSLFSLD
jgi:hypothetical protein